MAIKDKNIYAAIALALHEYKGNNVHDKEPGIITIKERNTLWNAKFITMTPKPQTEMKEYKYTIDGKEYKVEINDIKDNIADINVNGENFKVEMEPEKEPEKKKVVLGNNNNNENSSDNTVTPQNVNTNNAVLAPLPGVITEICVKVGDQVKAGDTLLILEAMKMANNIEAENSGKVTAILVKQGENVMEDTPLIVVE